MADKVIVTGQFNLTDSSGKTLVPFDLSTLIGTIDAVLEHEKSKRTIVDSDGPVTLNKGGVGTVRGFIIAISNGSGTITLKHDSNTVAMTIDKAMILVGSFDSVIVETTSTQALTIEYMFFE